MPSNGVAQHRAIKPTLPEDYRKYIGVSPKTFKRIDMEAKRLKIPKIRLIDLMVSSYFNGESK